MIAELEIRNFRGLRQVDLSGLRRINLVVGGNDTGKTSILEAMVLLLGDGNSIRELPITFRTNQSGSQSLDDNNDRENFWPWLFYDGNPDAGLHITASMDDGKSVTVYSLPEAEGDWRNAALVPTLERKVSSSNPERLVRFRRNQSVETGGSGEPPAGLRIAVLSTRAPNPMTDAENYNQVALLADGERRIEETMREVEPRVRRLRYAKLPRTHSPLIFADIGLSRAVPATQMGQAFNRLLHVYTHVMANSANVLLVDEIENGIFSESMPKIWKGLLALCEREGIQIFATTHSRECVMAAHAAAEERGKDELSVQRLQIVKGNVEAVRLGKEHLEVAAEMGLEVRS